MKIAVVSDTHRNLSKITKVCQSIKVENPDMILHLGDVTDDADYMEALLEREVRRVPGNCDIAERGPGTLFIKAEGLLILATHGHHHRVKSSLHDLAADAKKHGAKVALFGHTHIALEDEVEGITVLNPGSASLPKGGQKAGYAVMTVIDEAVAVKFIHI